MTFSGADTPCTIGHQAKLIHPGKQNNKNTFSMDYTNDKSWEHAKQKKERNR